MQGLLQIWTLLTLPAQLHRDFLFVSGSSRPDFSRIQAALFNLAHSCVLKEPSGTSSHVRMLELCT